MVGKNENFSGFARNRRDGEELGAVCRHGRGQPGDETFLAGAEERVGARKPQLPAPDLKEDAD
jgi:hypothetical protein